MTGQGLKCANSFHIFLLSSAPYIYFYILYILEMTNNYVLIITKLHASVHLAYFINNFCCKQIQGISVVAKPWVQQQHQPPKTASSQPKVITSRRPKVTASRWLQVIQFQVNPKYSNAFTHQTSLHYSIQIHSIFTFQTYKLKTQYIANKWHPCTVAYLHLT